MDSDDFKAALEGGLRFFPGIELKREQELCLEILLVKRKDVLGVLPTGYGKSLIYQLLPKVLSQYWFNKNGTRRTYSVLVVSPLELIRKQQVERLNKSGIKAAVLEDLSTLTFEDLDREEIEIVFGSAEQWLSEKWRESLKAGSFKRAEILIVDEVHTVETWGTGKKGKAAFRQAFGQVKDLRSFLGKKPLLALTATADKDMRQRLCKLLGFRDYKVVLISPNKENIRFTVAEADRNLYCLDWLVSLLKSKREQSPFCIIFCHTVSDIVLVLSTLLMKLGNDAYLNGTEPPPERCLVGVYYSATPDSAKERMCSSFSGSGKARVVIASTSLSMGIDFPHVRYVIHFGPGRTLTDHLQQAGRAGRDSEQAFNVILYQGKHLGQCERSVKEVISSKECVRKLLLHHFTDDDVSLTIKHDCCNRCHAVCSCGGEDCSVSYFDFDQLKDGQTQEVSQDGREVSIEDKECLRDALHEVKLSLDLRSGLTLFDASGMITHGFSDNVIDSVVDNCGKIHNINDLMQYGFISSLHIAVTVLEVLNEVFEDIIIESSLYELAVISKPVYKSVLDAASVCSDHYMESGSSSDSDC